MGRKQQPIDSKSCAPGVVIRNWGKGRSTLRINFQYKGGHQIRPFDRVSAASGHNHTHPAFCFRYIQRDYTIDNYDVTLQATVAKRLQHLGQITWAEIQKAPRHGTGHEIISQHAIKKPLPPDTPGDRHFLAFRLGQGKQSVMIGYRKAKVFYVVWVDPHGHVYSHG